MCFVKFIFLFYCLVIFECCALNCRTEGGQKESELKYIYQKCLKMQNKNSTNKNDDQDWKNLRGNIQKDRERDQTGDDNRRNNRNDGWMGSSDSRTGTSDSWISNSRINNNNRNRNDGTNSRNDGMGSRYDGGGNRYDETGIKDDALGNDDRMNNRNDYYGNHEERGRNDHLNGRNDFQTAEFDDVYQYNGYRSSTQTPRRYKRERRVDNTGQRSQYNPNTQSSSGYEDSYRSDDKNSSENTNQDNKACALQCFLEYLQMTAEDGMPDKYLVTQAITKDVRNEDLRDFLQESIEECFQILENEDSDDKCGFSKNLLLCLSEKGKANCDDWKDALRF